MNQPKTARVNMSLRRTSLALAILLVVCGTRAAAQQSLGDLVRENGFDWMIGKWVTTTDEGEKLYLEYKWELDKHVVTVHVKTPDFEYRGMILHKASEEQVVQIGADNQGGSGKGIWEAVGDKAILRHEHTGAYSETNRMGVAHSKVDADTMKVEIYEVYSDGQLAAEPASTIEFKRVKEQSDKKSSP